jgi:exodeoxyribonuclease VII small subunit
MVLARQMVIAKRLMSQNPPSNPPVTELSFEEAMARLDRIVQEMEEERLPLEDMVQTYEEGVRLLAQCRDRIEVARLRVEKINNVLDGQTGAALSHFDVPAEGETDSPGQPSAATPGPVDADQKKPKMLPMMWMMTSAFSN